MSIDAADTATIKKLKNLRVGVAVGRNHSKVFFFMAKRFIDTKLFDDEWFSQLSQDAKVMWIYIITKCDHAGLFNFNLRLTEFQTGIKYPERVIEELGNRLVRVKEDLIFCPKYIIFQYPDFPKSNVKQQESAIKLLIKAGLWNGNKLTLTKESINSYVNDSVNDSVVVNVNGVFQKDIFESKENAFEQMRDDDLFIESCAMTLSGRGWKAASGVDVVALIKNFLHGKADLEKPKKEVRQHFKNWISSGQTKLENLITLAEVFKKSA